MRAPDFVAVGYVTKDEVESREQAGGSCYYGANTALQMGLRPGIWTSASEDFLTPERINGIEVCRSPSDVTTTFTHYYDHVTGLRRHKCETQAPPIDPNTLPKAWKRSDLVVLSPNGAELSPDTIELFEPKKMALLPQGWFRRFHKDGSVSFGKSKWNQLPRQIDLSVVSVDDIAQDPESWVWIKKYSKVAVRTMGRKGHVLAWQGKEKHLDPPYVSKDVDPTGAGDVFSVSMLIALFEGADPEEAARFGSVAASFAVEKPGIEGIPTREQVAYRLEEAEPGVSRTRRRRC
jgi:1D-myo-inositol 3-kinase